MKKIIIVLSCMLSIQSAEQQGVCELTEAFQDFYIRSQTLSAGESLRLLGLLDRNAGAIDLVQDRSVLANIDAFLTQPLERPGHESCIISCCLSAGLGLTCSSCLDQFGYPIASKLCCFSSLLYTCYKVVVGTIRERATLTKAQEEKERIQRICADRRIVQKKDQ